MMRDIGAIAAARVATTWARRVPPRSRAVRPTRTIDALCATAEKNRTPTSDGPNSSRASRPMKGVSGGYATYPQAR